MNEPISLVQLQMELKSWQHHNFPGRTSDRPFKGMVEELGELAHAILKQEQGIRGTKEEHEEAIKDSIADLLIFMTDFCNARGFWLQDLLNKTWPEVRKRDWVKFPKNGIDQ